MRTINKVSKSEGFEGQSARPLEKEKIRFSTHPCSLAGWLCSAILLMVQQITENSGQKVRNTIYHAAFRNTAQEVDFARILPLIKIILTCKSTKRHISWVSLWA